MINPEHFTIKEETESFSKSIMCEVCLVSGYAIPRSHMLSTDGESVEEEAKRKLKERLWNEIYGDINIAINKAEIELLHGAPLSELTYWVPKVQEVFEKLKQLTANPFVRSLPMPGEPWPFDSGEKK